MADRPRTRGEICRWLRITDAQLNELIDKGLPHVGDEFMPHEVAQWLEAKGIGQRCGFRGVVRTLADVARAFGVTKNTVQKDWRPDGMPGRTGHWDLSAIHAWKRARNRDESKQVDPLAHGEDQQQALDSRLRKHAAEARIKEADAAAKERRNRLEEENIIYRNDVERFFSEFFTRIRDQFATLSEEVSPLLPKEIKEDFAEDLDKRVEDRFRALHRWVSSRIGDASQAGKEQSE